METATAVLDSFDSVFECFELCTKQELLKLGFLIISFILGTVDMVTDWINWKRWSSFGGYSQYYFIYIFQTAFLCAAVVGSILWTAEVFLMIKRSREFIRRYKKRSRTNKMEKRESTQKSKDISLSSRVGFTVRLLIGLMEDLPVVILLYYSMVIPFCGISQVEESLSPTALATVVSSMLNSLWTLFILYWDLFGCNKKLSNAECCCSVIRTVYEQTSLCVCYCGCCGCATNSNCGCLCLGQYRVEKSQPSKATAQSRCKRIGCWIGKLVLFGIIFLLYLTIFFVGGVILSNMFSAPVVDQSVLGVREFTRSIKADKIGPGLDSRTDAAMFVTMVYELPNWYHVGLYDNRDVNTANSASVAQIQNRLYIGQFSELEHLKDGTLTKVIPCSRVFPSFEQIDGSLFQWNNSQNLNTIDISSCKLIFRLRYHPTNNNWNPFINFVHTFFKYITIEWGINIEDKETCPIGFIPLPVSSLLTDTVKQDIVNYTCSPSCINATNICHNTTYGRFEESDSKTSSTPMTGQPQFYLTINDQQTVDSCHFKTFFEYTSEFCNKYWTGFPPVTVPDFVKHLYPQFITIPMTYKKTDTPYPFLDSKCSKLWAEEEKIWF